MKLRLAALACFLGALSPGKSPGAELVPEPRVRPSVKIEISNLISQDIQARTQVAARTPSAGPSTDGTPEGALDLPPMVVTKRKPPDLTPPPKEPKLQEFFRTGTILQNRTGTIRLWMKGDEGLMLTFPF